MNCLPVSNLSLTATSGGRQWNLNQPNRVSLLGYDGTGIMTVARISQKFPRQVGATDLGFDQGQRALTLLWGLYGLNLPDYYQQLRSDMLAMATPRDGDPVTFLFGVPGIGDRAIEAHLQGNLDFLAGDREYTHQRVSGLFVCPDPRFYDPSQQSVELIPISQQDGWTIDGVGSSYGWTVGGTGSTRGWLIGGSQINDAVTFLYASGDRTAAPEFPRLTILGPITDPIIRHRQTGEQIAFSGLTVGANLRIIIDLADGPFSESSPIVRDQDGNSVEQFLTNDSDLATWHLVPAGEKLPDGTYSDGTNTIELLGSGGSSETRLLIDYYNRYIGF